MTIEIEQLQQKLAVIQLSVNSHFDLQSLLSFDFFSISKTDKEISIIIHEESLPENLESIAKVAKDWIGFRIKGALEFNQCGILSSLLKPLAEAKIPVFVFSTYDTDYILVQARNAEMASSLLECG